MRECVCETNPLSEQVCASDESDIGKRVRWEYGYFSIKPSIGKRERKRVRARLREKERVCVWVSQRVREREREGGGALKVSQETGEKFGKGIWHKMITRDRIREKVGECLSERERERKRERERERECVWMREKERERWRIWAKAYFPLKLRNLLNLCKLGDKNSQTVSSIKISIKNW